MSINNFPEMLRDFAPSLGDHLWQSMLFLAAAGLLNLLLRNNSARVRYGIWFVASIKFMIPFSLLVGLGSRLAKRPSIVNANSDFIISIRQFSQPFSQASTSSHTNSTLTELLNSFSHFIPVWLAVAWLGGATLMMLLWWSRWRKISFTIRNAVLLTESREVSELRRVERVLGMGHQIPILQSTSTLEPGIFGVVRPVLIWPQGISARLEDGHLASVLAHELCHVRRRDNLAAAIHMVVQTIFWFHPLVWWLGQRLLETRELACDEAVLGMGSEPHVYAQSILKICEFCVSSPLNCVSGVTGADLKKRIAYIMKENVMQKLNFGKRLLLVVAGLAVVVTPLLFGLLNATQSRAQSGSQESSAMAAPPTLESASIKLNKEGTDALKTGGVIRQRVTSKQYEFSAENASLRDLLRIAFKAADYQLSGIPKTFDGQLYDVEARANKTSILDAPKLGKDQVETLSRQIVEALLKKQLHLQFHRETREMPTYFLRVTESGKLHEVKGECSPPSGPSGPSANGTLPPSPCGYMRLIPVGQLDGQKVSLPELAANLTNITRKTVSDETNLKGKYDITLKWAPDSPIYPEYTGPRDQPDPHAVPLAQALQEQLGLHLEPTTSQVEVLVIDHIEEPPSN